MASSPGGETALCPENPDAPSCKSTPESVDKTDDCAGLSVDTKNLLLIDEQCRYPDTETHQVDLNSSVDNDTPYSCDKQCAHASEITLPPGSPGADTAADRTLDEAALHKSTAQHDVEAAYQVEDPELPGITLVDLPTEVILQLCSYLDSRFLIGTLRIVCRRFYTILSDDFIWRSRIMKKWTQLYPAIPTTDEVTVDWRDACLHLEDQRSLWTNKDQLMDRTKWKHFSCVHSVILVNDGALCVSGSRDHSIAIWDVESLNEMPLAHIEGHKGWVWRLAADTKSTFYSGSFDNTLKLWSLEEGIHSTSVYDCKYPVMSIASAPNFAAAALQNNQVCLFDPRAFTGPISTYNLSRGFGLVVGITCENGTPDMCISGDQNGCVSVWDVRAGKMLKDIPMVKSKPKSPLIPLSMSLRKDSCYVGDSKGKLHLMDPRRESETAFEIVATYEPGHSRLGRINAINHGKGHLFSGGSDGFIYIFSPTHEPELITSFQIDTEITSMDYQNNILVVGTDTAVVAYKPITPA